MLGILTFLLPWWMDAISACEVKYCKENMRGGETLAEMTFRGDVKMSHFFKTVSKKSQI